MYGFVENPLARKSLEELLVDSLSNAPSDVSNLQDVLLGGLWAWERMPRRLMRWGWTSTGIIDKKTMATIQISDAAQKELEEEDDEAL